MGGERSHSKILFSHQCSQRQSPIKTLYNSQIQIRVLTKSYRASFLHHSTLTAKGQSIEYCLPILQHSTAGLSVSHPHWNHYVLGKLFCAFDLYSGSIECPRLNRLALAINYDTNLTSVLFEMRDSGEFPTFTFHLFLSFHSDFCPPSLHKTSYCLCFLLII